jgi:methyl-accepting chemotaxis protein
MHAPTTNFMERLSLRRLLQGALASAALGMVCLTAVSLYEGFKSKRLANELAADVRMARAAGSVDMMHDALRSDALAALLAGPQAEAAEAAAIRKDVEVNGKTLTEQLEALRSEGGDRLGSAGQAAIAKAAAYRTAAATLVNAALTDTAKAQDLRPAFDRAFDELEAELEAMSGTIEEAANRRAAGVNAFFAQVMVAVAGSVLLCLLGLVALWAVGQRQLRALTDGLRVAQAVAQGDLSSQVTVRGSNEAAQLMDALSRMNQRLREIVQTVRMNSDGVATASAQIASGNLDLSQRTEQQASRLQEAASSMQQLGGLVERNTEHTRQADAMARQAVDVARQGGTAVHEVVSTMNSIHASSKRIADITGVIDGIAFQTSILALNAAVEAARAGEQGRGFAVVATEVRALAKRSADAAREIKNLIGSSAQQVEQGSALAGRAGGTMQDIVSAIERLTALMGDIHSAGSDQASSVAAVGTAVGDLDRATQQNAALVEESAAAAGSLRQQADRLVASVAVFQLGSGSR